MSALARRATHLTRTLTPIFTYTLPTGDFYFAQRATRFFFLRAHSLGLSRITSQEVNALHKMKCSAKHP